MGSAEGECTAVAVAAETRKPHSATENGRKGHCRGVNELELAFAPALAVLWEPGVEDEDDNDMGWLGLGTGHLAQEHAAHVHFRDC